VVHGGPWRRWATHVFRWIVKIGIGLSISLPSGLVGSASQGRDQDPAWPHEIV
jgi:hypothetical protein